MKFLELSKFFLFFLFFPFFLLFFIFQFWWKNQIKPKILSSAEHYRVIDDGFVVVSTVENLTENSFIRHFAFKFNKMGYDFHSLDLNKKLEEKENEPIVWISARRSVQVFFYFFYFFFF